MATACNAELRVGYANGGAVPRGTAPVPGVRGPGDVTLNVRGEPEDGRAFFGTDSVRAMPAT